MGGCCSRGSRSRCSAPAPRRWGCTGRSRPPIRTPRAVVFTVAPGEPLGAIARQLESDGLVRSARAVEWIARLRGLDGSLRAGEYALSAAAVARRDPLPPRERPDRQLPGRAAGGLHGRPDRRAARRRPGWSTRQAFDAGRARSRADRLARDPGPEPRGLSVPRDLSAAEGARRRRSWSASWCSPSSRSGGRSSRWPRRRASRSTRW